MKSSKILTKDKAWPTCTHGAGFNILFRVFDQHFLDYSMDKINGNPIKVGRIPCLWTCATTYFSSCWIHALWNIKSCPLPPLESMASSFWGMSELSFPSRPGRQTPETLPGVAAPDALVLGVRSSPCSPVHPGRESAHRSSREFVNIIDV